MVPYLFRASSYISWWLNAVDEHSLHSPFFFDLYNNVIKGRVSKGEFEHIEKLRSKLLRDSRVIPVRDLGSGDHLGSQRSVSSIARTSISPRRFSCIYNRLVRHFKSKSIIELGTSFGINTLYLSEDHESTVATFEGSPAIADIAALTFEFASRSNIRMISGNIDRTLPAFMQSLRRIDFALMDANHRYEPTVRYFESLVNKVHERSVIVIDDIHYSPEMGKAWKEIKSHRLVHASADLYRCGIVFFDPSLNKQHVILQV